MNEIHRSKPSSIRHARRIATQIAKSHFNAGPTRVKHQASGLSNFVFQLAHPEGQFIVRIAPSVDRLNTFTKEQWAVARACDAGVPTARLLQVGIHEQRYPYMISE